jgi:6-phosphogluconolactonase
VLNAGGDGNITGFTMAPNGHLTRLVGSTRSLNLHGMNPPDVLVSPAQVGFTPRGDLLVVTIKGSPGLDSQIQVFAVDRDGMPSVRPVTTFLDRGPFGFVFSGLNTLIVTEPIGANGLGAVSSYRVAADGSLEPTSTVGPSQTATCWLSTDITGRYAFGTDNLGGTISSFMVAPDGSLDRISPMAAETGRAPVDLTIAGGGRFLYNVNAADGTVGMFMIDQKNGDLIPLGEIGGLPDDGSAVGIAAR